MRVYIPFNTVTRLIYRKFSSALFITGDKATNNFAALTPHIDFEERVQHWAELVENIKLRELNIDLEKLDKHWKFYTHLREQRDILDQTKTAINEEINKLMNEPEPDEKALAKLKLHAKLAKDDKKNLRDYLYGVEESAVLGVLSLPNVLDQRTPHLVEVVVHSFLEKPTKKSLFHIDVAKKNDWIEYINPTFVFLKNEAALFEFAVINYCHDFLLDCSFTQCSNASFARTLIVEGCTTDYTKPREVFTLENEGSEETINRLHLVGGATLYSFMAYFTRYFLQTGNFPVKLFSSGRQYKPVESKECSLFNLEQNSAVQIFIITKNVEEDSNFEFNNIVGNVKKLYENLGYHFRMVYLPAKQLKIYESLRCSIQMYSTHSEQYVEVGHVSLCDNFLSKRLLITYSENKERKYPKVITGTLLNVYKLLACVLEYSDTNNETVLSDLLKQSL